MLHKIRTFHEKLELNHAAGQISASPHQRDHLKAVVRDCNPAAADKE